MSDLIEAIDTLVKQNKFSLDALKSIEDIKQKANILEYVKVRLEETNIRLEDKVNHEMLKNSDLENWVLAFEKREEQLLQLRQLIKTVCKLLSDGL